MNIGKMRHRITFQKQKSDKDSLGSYSSEEEDWEDVATVWAQISPISGKEYFSEMRENTVSHKIYCRYRAGISPKMRVKFKDRVFRIISVINWEERNEGLTIMCEELIMDPCPDILLKALKEQMEEGL